MNRYLDWLGERFQERPGWMNAAMVFCAFMAFVYVPWDFLFKPLAADEEAWFGLLLHGWAAKLTEPIHFAMGAVDEAEQSRLADAGGRAGDDQVQQAGVDRLAFAQGRSAVGLAAVCVVVRV